MKISNIYNDPNLIPYIQQNNKQPAVDKNQLPQEIKDKIAAEYKVDLSTESKEMKKIQDLLAATPDVRAERVEALKKLIESGQYKVDSNALAEKMIKEFLWDVNE